MSRFVAWVVVAVAVVSLLGCAGQADVVDVPLETLVIEQEEWDGRVVRARGSVSSFEDPLHYWIEDPVTNRVELVPQDGLDDLVGETVEVVGVFTFDESEGRRIEIDELAVLDD